MKKLSFWNCILLLYSAVFAANFLHWWWRQEFLPWGDEKSLINLFRASIWVFVISGIVPIIWWGLRKFEYSKSFAPMITWVILNIFLFGTAFAGSYIVYLSCCVKKPATYAQSERVEIGRYSFIPPTRWFWMESKRLKLPVKFFNPENGMAKTFGREIWTYETVRIRPDKRISRPISGTHTLLIDSGSFDFSLDHLELEIPCLERESSNCRHARQEYTMQIHISRVREAYSEIHEIIDQFSYALYPLDSFYCYELHVTAKGRSNEKAYTLREIHLYCIPDDRDSFIRINYSEWLETTDTFYEQLETEAHALWKSLLYRG